MRSLIIIKRDAAGQEQLRYRGVIHQQTAAFVCIDATFALADRNLGYIQLRRGDRFREWFYFGRWYNIFRVGDTPSGALKGWYCNITRPPVMAGEQIMADDLCLDLFVYPDGRALLVDEDEFAQLALEPGEQAAARRAVAELRRWSTCASRLLTKSTRLFEVGTDHQHRHIDIVHNLVGDAAKDQPHQARVSMRRHDHQISCLFLDIFDDMLRHAHSVYNVQAAVHAFRAHFIAQVEQVLLDFFADAVCQFKFAGDSERIDKFVHRRRKNMHKNHLATADARKVDGVGHGALAPSRAICGHDNFLKGTVLKHCSLAL